MSAAFTTIGEESPMRELEYLLAHRDVPIATETDVRMNPDARKVWKENLGLRWSDFPFVYYSLLRPLTVVQREFERLVGEGNIHVFNVEARRDPKGSRRPTGVILSKVKLPLDTLESYELSIHSSDWKPALIRVVEANPRRPVELAAGANTDHPSLYLVFKNPRKNWQVSYFDQRGPNGHHENADLTKAIMDAEITGPDLRVVDGVLDEWAPDFDQKMLDWMAENHRRGLMASKKE